MRPSRLGRVGRHVIRAASGLSSFCSFTSYRGAVAAEAVPAIIAGSYLVFLVPFLRSGPVGRDPAVHLARLGWLGRAIVIVVQGALLVYLVSFVLGAVAVAAVPALSAGAYLV